MRVLASPAFANSNAYIGSLYEGIVKLGHDVGPLSYRELVSGCDICHVHWPDLALSKRSLFSSFCSVVRLFALVFVAKCIMGAKVVWTVHNFKPHDCHLPEWWVSLFYAIWYRFVDGYIFLSRVSMLEFRETVSSEIKWAVIPHGHYCDHYLSVKPAAELLSVLGIDSSHLVFGHYGQIREYKNTVELIRCFSNLPGEGLRLIVGGKVRQQDRVLEADIRALAKADSRVILILRFLEDSELVTLFRNTSYAVLPYRHILNSGSALLALSLGCPVLVPDLPAMRELRDEIGHEAIGLIGPEGLEAAMAGVVFSKELPRCERHQLMGFEWAGVCRDTAKFYEGLCR